MGNSGEPAGKQNGKCADTGAYRNSMRGNWDKAFKDTILQPYELNSSYPAS